MRFATLILLALLAVVQAELWFGKGGLPRVWALGEQVTALKQANEAAMLRNDQLAAEVRDLKEGLEMVEERARMELGMLKADELFVQLGRELAPRPSAQPDTGAAPADASTAY